MTALATLRNLCVALGRSALARWEEFIDPYRPAPDLLAALRELTTDPAQLQTRLDQAARLEAAGASDTVVQVAVRTAATGRFTLEDLLRLREDGTEVDGLIDAVRRKR